MAARIRVRHALPLWQRLRRRWRAWRGARMVKTHLVHFVDVDGVRFKRVRFAEVGTAQAVAQVLAQLAETSLAPALSRQQDSEVWVDFVPGRAPKAADIEDQARLVDFFASLYAVGQAVAADPGPYASGLQEDLQYLSRAGLVAPERAAGLAALEKRLRPHQVWIGPDYIDPVAKNFIVVGRGLVAIDIEALADDALLGTGLAKARLRWPFDPIDSVCARLSAGAGPDLATQLPWVELCFLCRYFKEKLLQGKPGHIRLEALDRLLNRE